MKKIFLFFLISTFIFSFFSLAEAQHNPFSGTKIDPNSALSTVLTGNEEITTTGTSVVGFGSININVMTDQSSDANGLIVQYSSNNTNWDVSETYSVVGGTNTNIVTYPKAAYFRIIYRNGSSVQTYFRMQAILKQASVETTGIDETNGYIVSATPGESAINNGNAFHCDYTNTCTNTGEKSVIAFKTGNTTKWVHATSFFSSTAGAYAYIAENTNLTLSTALTVTASNRDRNSTTASTITTIGTPATAGSFNVFDETAAATLPASIPSSTSSSVMWLRPLGNATAGADSGQQDRQVNKWILKQNTQYVWVVESTSADDNVHHIMINFTEKTNK